MKYPELLAKSQEEKPIAFEVLDRFKYLLAPLKGQTLEDLTSLLLSEGIKSPLLLGKVEDTIFLVDGHNRYEIAQKHGLSFKTELKEFESLEQVEKYIIDLQLGRRNLTENEIDYLRGKQAQNATKKEVAKIHQISEKTVQRDNAFSKGVDKIGEKNPDLRRKILDGSDKTLTKEQIRSLANVDVPKVESLKDLLKLPEKPKKEAKAPKKESPKEAPPEEVTPLCPNTGVLFEKPTGITSFKNLPTPEEVTPTVLFEQEQEQEQDFILPSPLFTNEVLRTISKIYATIAQIVPPPECSISLDISRNHTNKNFSHKNGLEMVHFYCHVKVGEEYLHKEREALSQYKTLEFLEVLQDFQNFLENYFFIPNPIAFPSDLVLVQNASITDGKRQKILLEFLRKDLLKKTISLPKLKEILRELAGAEATIKLNEMPTGDSLVVFFNTENRKKEPERMVINIQKIIFEG